MIAAIADLIIVGLLLLWAMSGKMYDWLFMKEK
jgi:hypothetical protein